MMNTTDWVMKLSVQGCTMGLTLGSVRVASAEGVEVKPGVWTPAPLISRQAREAGVTLGGEGRQWLRTIAVDSADGSFVLYGTDVGGLFRSLDGGKTWEPANVGFRPRGSSGGAAIDPHNPDRVLVVAGNSVVSDFHGLYLSTDRAASWSHVQQAKDAGSQDFRQQLAFDPSTYDPQRKMTTDVYWSRVAKDTAGWGDVNPQPALYKSTDGGASWSRLDNTEHLGGGVVKVHPAARGVVYIATPDTLYRSDDGAATFQTLLKADASMREFTGFDVSADAPDRLVLCTPDALLISEDRGRTFETRKLESIAESGFTVRDVRISPADADRIMLWRHEDNGWDWRWYTSQDAGKTFQRSRHDNTLAFLPYNNRQGVFAMHPTDPNVIVGTGGDWPTRSTDGGKTFAWSASGYNVVLVGGMFHFSVSDPDVLFFGSQDYNGAVTTDAGHTWTYVNPANETWGGFTYGGYAASDQLLFVGKALGWGGIKTLRISRDGGATWSERDDVRFTDKSDDTTTPWGLQSALADASDPLRVLYFGPHRSDDAGQTWSLMPDCDGVVFTGTDDDGPYTLGIDRVERFTRSRLLQSRDAGKTWKELAVVDGEARDLAIDRSRNRLYVVVEGTLRAVDLKTGSSELVPTLTDEWGSRRVRSVALDPVDPSIVYAAQNRDVHTTARGAMVSGDAGASWTNLNLESPLEPGMVDGGREPFWARVHPVTRDLWVATGCMGIWKINVVNAK